MWNLAAHHITLTFSGFLCFDCLLSNAPHSSKVNEAKQKTNKKVGQKMLIYWQRLRNAKVMQNSNTVIPALLIPRWNKCTQTSPSENFAVHEAEKWPSLSSSKSWINAVTPQGLKFLFQHNCGMKKNKEQTREEVRKITSLTNYTFTGAGTCVRGLRSASQLTMSLLQA